MFGIDFRAARVVWTVLLFAAVLGFAWAARRVLLLLAFAVVFAYLVFPLVRALQSWRVMGARRGLAVGVVYLVLIGVLVGAGAALGPRLRDETTALGRKAPEISQELQSGHVIRNLLGRRGWASPLAEQADDYLRANAQAWTGYAQQVAATIVGWLAGAWMIVLVPIFAFFFLKDGERLAGAIESTLETRPGRGVWRGITHDVHHLLGHYVGALIALCLITFTVWLAVFAVAGVRYAVLLAALGGALEFIPVVGPVVAGALVLGVNVFTGGGHPVLLLGFLIAWRLVQDYVTSPLVMGSGVELHPALVIFGVIAGGEIAGVPGMFFSVPVLAGLRVVWRRLHALHHVQTGTAHGEAADLTTRATGSRATRGW
jgi:predicted PurR-regulated permease PerM